MLDKKEQQEQIKAQLQNLEEIKNMNTETTHPLFTLPMKAIKLADTLRAMREFGPDQQAYLMQRAADAGVVGFEEQQRFAWWSMGYNA